jgi:hypothetical protein
MPMALEPIRSPNVSANQKKKIAATPKNAAPQSVSVP